MFEHRIHLNNGIAFFRESRMLTKSIVCAPPFAKWVFVETALEKFDVVHIYFGGYRRAENGYIEDDAVSLFARRYFAGYAL